MAAKQSIPQKVGDRPEMKYLTRYVRGKLCGACEENPEAWKDVGRELMSDSDATLSTIAVNSRGNVITCCSSLFKQWLQRQPDASWEHLIEALKVADLNDVATEIEGMLEPSTDLIHKTETAKPQMKTNSSPSPAKPSQDLNSQLSRKPEPLVMPPMDTIKHNPDLLGDEKWPNEPPKPVVYQPPSAEDVTDVNGLPHYQMKTYPQGIGVIINNKKFHGHGRDRKGTDIDATALEKLFTYLGFYTKRFDNLTAKQMKDKLTEASKIDHKKYDCLMVAILTHGDEGKLYGIDDKSIPVEDLTKLFYGDQCPSLVGKPKIFILQACRGKNNDTGVTYDMADEDDDKKLDYKVANEEQCDLIDASKFIEEEDEIDSTGTLPSKADFVLAYSTIPGYVSWRSREKGSYFITALINVFTEEACREHLLDMLTEVNRKVAVEFESSGGKKKQIPEPVYTLQKKLYFNPGMV